jgi:hypothetical protein
MGTDSASHREILTCHYPEECARIGSGTVAFETFQGEARVLFRVNKVSTLPQWWRENTGRASRRSSSFCGTLDGDRSLCGPAVRTARAVRAVIGRG